MLAPLSKSVLRRAARAVRDFDLIGPGDRVAVGVSGGKDSLMLLAVCDALASRDDLDFTFEAVHLDQRQPGFDRSGFNAALAAFDVKCHVLERDTWSVVSSELEPGQIPCSLCSRMRRGILLDWCASEGFTKLAMGHHLDDAIETFFLNLCFQRRLDPLKPATPSRQGVTTVRPLILVEEQQVVDWVERSGIHPIGCPVCDGFPRSQRRDTGALITQLSASYPDLRASVRQALYGAS